MTLRKLTTLPYLLTSGALVVGAQQRSGLPPLLPRDREVALALSAAPSYISGQATVYVLEASGYVRVREGSNGFTCLVVRDYAQDLAPVCHDPEGTRTVVPRLLREADLRAQGKTEQQIREEINEGLRTGKYRVPQRLGVAYMLSQENRGFLPDLGRVVSVKPHVMFYAPYLRNEDIGAKAPKPPDFPDYPFVMTEGQFNAYLIMQIYDGDESRRSQNMADFAPEAFARDWVATWNRSDAEAILTHYADDVVFVSPLAATITGNPEVHGKAALRAYWTTALRSRSSPPQFLLESFVWDDENRTLLVVYISTEQSHTVRKCELMHFRPDGLIDRGEAFAGAVVGSPQVK